MERVRKGDTVVVIAGKNKGQRGKVLRIVQKTNRVVIERVQMIKKHMKPSQKNPQGGIVEKESPIAVSNTKLVCPKCDKPTAVSRQVQGDGTRARICRNCSAVIE